MQALTNAYYDADHNTSRFDFGKCVICRDSPRTHVFTPCGHICACEKCSQELTITKDLLNDPSFSHEESMTMKQLLLREPFCPVCKEEIQLSMRVLVPAQDA